MSTWEEELNAELNDVQKHKPPISASRVSSVTKLAYKHRKHANDIAFMIENFLELAKPEYKLAALYLIDSICKAKKQSDRDIYVKRFSQNIENTVNRVLDCTEKDKAAVKKVINLWVSQKVFNENILQTVAQVMQQRIGVVPDGITIQPVQPTVGFDAQALLATIASQTPSQPVNYNYNNAGATTMPMNATMPGQVPVGMGAPITNYANPAAQFSYIAPTVTSTPIVPVTPIQPRPAAQPLDSALFDIYDDLEDDEQRIAEQKKRREEEEQKRREEQDRLFNLNNNQAAPIAEQPVVVQPTPVQVAPTPAAIPPQVQMPNNMPPTMPMQQPNNMAMNAMHGAPFNQQAAPIQSQGLPPPPNTYQPMPVPQQQPPNMGRGGGYVPPQAPYGQFQPNPAASGNFQQQGMQQGFPGGPNQFNNGPPQFNGQVPPNMQGKGPMGRGRGRGFNNYAPDPNNLPTGEPVGNNMVRNKSKILFIGNLAPTVTEEHLGKIYSKYTGEAKVRYLAPKHMAFVAFTDRAIAEKAKEETAGKFLEGRDLKVGWAMEFKSDDFNRDTGEATVPMNAISMYRADQFVVLAHNPNDVIPLEEPRGRGRGGFGRGGGGDFNGMGRGRGGFGRGRGLHSYDDNSHYGGGHRNFQSQWSHPQQSGGDDGSDYSVKLTGGEDDKGSAKGAQGAGYGGQYDNYYDSYYYGTGDQAAEYYQQYYAAAAADPYAAKSTASSDDKNRSGSGPSSRKRSRSRSRSRDRRRSRSRSRSRDRRSGGRRRSRSKSRSRSRSRDRDSKRRKL